MSKRKRVWAGALSAVMMFSLLTFTAGCTKKTGEVTIGKIEGTTFTNDYFGITLEVPSGWNIATKEQMDQLVGQTADADSESAKDKTDLSKLRTLNMLFAFKHPIDYTEGVNANIMCMAENLSLENSSNIKTGIDFLNAAKAMMQQNNLPYTYGEIKTETIGGKAFDTMEVKVTVGEKTITQKYHTLILNGYAFNIITNYETEDELNELNASLATVKLNK